MKDFKYKKQIIFGASIFLFICVLVVLVLFFVFSNKTSPVSASNIIDTNISEDISFENTVDNTETTENEDTNVVPEIAKTEKASKEELKKEKVTKKEIKKSTVPYYIKVNYKANTVTVYTKDNDGNYTVPYKAMVCSCGTYTPTSGTYKTSNKYKWGKLIHNVYGQYSTRIVGSILFHSVPYSLNKKDTLLYDEYDKLGTTASAGCVRLTVRDAKWIYDNCASGTMVEFYSDSNPGPLSKPSAQKISSNEECRNWDPTDPASDNPWHTYKKTENSNENKEQENKTNISNTIDNSNINNVISNEISTGNSITSNNTITGNNSNITENSSNITESNSNISSNNSSNTSTNSATDNSSNSTVSNNNLAESINNSATTQNQL